MSGSCSYHAGLAAEDQVAELYQRNGRAVTHRRWRGKGGEIDLVARDGDDVVFIEVKKSRDFARAAESLSSRQMRRIWAAASEFLAGEPLGQMTPSRFDVALVNGVGQIDVIENAFAA